MPITRHWLIPQAERPKVYTPHPVMSPDEIRARTQGVWDQFYSLRRIWDAIVVHAEPAGAAGLRAHLEAVSADVRQYRDRDRQRAREPGQSVGPADRQAVPASVHGSSHAVPATTPKRGAGHQRERPFVGRRRDRCPNRSRR